MKTVVCSPNAPAPIGPYSQAVRAGNLLFCSGQVPLDPASGALLTGDIQVQTERVLENLKGLLAQEGLSLGNVVKTTVFLTDLAEFAGMNEVYGRYFTAGFPARSTVQVAALPKGAKVEIEAVAHY